MAQDMFIKIDGIEGESLDASHKNEIEVLSWRWGQQPACKYAQRFRRRFR